MNNDYTKEFLQDCLRTESSDFDKIKERIADPNVATVFRNILLEFIDIANDLDVIKKYLFYGKIPAEGFDRFFHVHLMEEKATLQNVSDKNIRLLHAGLGFATEAAEYWQQLSDHLFDEQELDEVNIKEEIFDKMWYDSVALDALGECSFEPGMRKIIAKLRKRFGDKFSEQSAVDRNLKAERDVLES